MSAFVLFQFSHWGMYTCFMLKTCANKDVHLHQFETHVFDFWPQLLLLQIVSVNVPSMGQLELVKNYSYLIGLYVKKTLERITRKILI